jgi:lipopolysaccharide transport system ATP-binding protein
VEAGGRISALLELGIGFHPDFTGRQNVFMAGHILGLDARRISDLMDPIEAFAEIGDHIDQPVRTYSSGMSVRLAFSIATAVRPDILIVDEALSVGDAYFQHKSFDRIRDFRSLGTTILFVTHDAAMVKSLCDRAILIDRGLLLRDGAPEAVLDYYNALVAVQHAGNEIHQHETIQGRSVTRSGSGEVVIESVDLLREDRSTRAVRSGDAVAIRVSMRSRVSVDELTLGILLRDRLGNEVFGTNTFHLGATLKNVPEGQSMVADFVFPDLNLGVGTYTVSAALHRADTHVARNYDWWDRSLVFQIIPGKGPVSIGLCNLPVEIAWRSR